MKNKLITVVLAVLVVIVFGNNQAVAQQDTKLAKAEATFCASITNLIAVLESFDAVNEEASMDDFRKAYKSAEKAYNKYEKSAQKLEKVEIKESVKAYSLLSSSGDPCPGRQAGFRQSADKRVRE